MTTTTLRPIDRVLDALGYHGQRNGGNYKCICPAHDDGRESLSVTEADDGKVLIKCFAGCSAEKIVTAVGLKMADLMPSTENAKRKKSELGPIIREYNYNDVYGNILFQATRHNPKDFRQRRPDGKGGWIWGLKGVELVPYNLRMLHQATPDDWVFIVEGEKDVENLHSCGIDYATCNPMGAGKWRDSYNQYFKGLKVCVLPDNDEPGRQHAQQVARSVQSVAAEVRIVELPGLSEKGDVSDWLTNGGTADQLLAMIEAVPSFIAPTPQPPTIHLNSNGAAHIGDTTSMLVDHPTHDHGNAEVVVALNQGRFAYCHELGWMRRIDTHWDTQNAEFDVNRAITRTLIRRRMAAVEAEREDVVKATIPNESRKNAVKGMYRDIVAVSLAEFDNDPNVLNCANGVIDLRTGQLVTHGPSDRFTYCVQTPYSAGADVSAWLGFLSNSVGDYAEIADWLQMAFGYSITGLTREECMFYIHGPSRSGKGTFAQAALTLLGSPLARGVDFSTFTKARDGDSQNFDLAPLRPARFISASESGRYASLNEAVVKNITGNDPITAAYKHRDQFTYTPQFKIWLASNHPAKGDVDDDAFWGRLRVIRFPNSHLGTEDKTLKWRISSPEVLPGVLAWAVEGARRWYASKQGLIIPYAVHASTQAHRSEHDQVQQWLEECAEPVADNTVTNTALYLSYKNWCDENGHTPKKSNMFGRALVAKGFEQCQKKIGGTPHRAYRGLCLREDTTEND